MREIKFRAWWKNETYCPNGKMYRVGGLLMGKKEEGEPEYNFENTIPLDIGLIDREGHYLKIGWNLASECVLLQYTCLKDKNGKEIYEGDILSPGGRVVEFCIDVRFKSQWETYGGVGFYTRANKGLTRPEELGIFSFGITQAEVSEVIGNIYEHPDLIK